MNLKIKKSQFLNYFVITAIVVLELHFFRLIDDTTLPGTGSNIRMLSVRIILLAFIYLMIIKKGAFLRILNKYKYVAKTTVLVCLFCLIEVFYSMLQYNQSLFNVWWGGYYFLAYLLIYILLDTFTRDGGVEKFTKYVNMLILISLVLIIGQAFLYNTTGRQILSINYSSASAVRNGRLRISLNSMLGFFLAYNLNQIIEKKHSLINLLSVGLVVVGSFYTEMTRGNQIAIVVTIIAVYLYNKKMDIKKLLVLLVGLIVVGYAINSGVLDSFFASLFQKSSSTYTTGHRLDAISYFMSYWQSHPIFGMGFILPNRSDLYSILYSSSGVAYYDDIGIIGFLLHFGVFGVLILGATFGRMIYIFLKDNGINYRYKPLLFGILIYFIATMPSLSLYDPQRIIMWPIYMSLFEYIHNKLKEETVYDS